MRIQPILTRIILLLVCYSFLNKSFGQTSITTPVFCPDSVKKHKVQWANLGVGISTSDIFNSIAGINVGLNYHWKPNRITYLMGASYTQQPIDGPDLGVINGGIGKSLLKKHYRLSFLAGPGIMWGMEKNDFMENEHKFVKPGLSLNVELIGVFVQGIGMGLEFYSNINSVRNVTGVRFVFLHLYGDK